MSKTVEVRVPDIGNFKDVEVIGIPVKPGDIIQLDDTLATLESDKAALDIPSPYSGVIKEIKIQLGDKVSQGTPLLILEQTSAAAVAAVEDEDRNQVTPSALLNAPAGEVIDTEVLVLGAGPGGYTAAFRAADLGRQVMLIERHANLGGVCLNVGCIPSKALLHVAHIINEAHTVSAHGVSFGAPEIDRAKLLDWKNSVINKLTGGLAGLAKQRKVKVMQGVARFSGSHEACVETATGTVTIRFQQAIIAAGSRPVEIPGFPYDDPRLINSSGALALADIPAKMLVIGGGIIGLEMATVYAALGSQISVVELMDGLVPGCDKDLVRPLEKIARQRYAAVYLSTKVTKIEALDEGLKVWFEGAKAPEFEIYDRVLVAVGRRPNGLLIGAENAGVKVDERGFIAVDKQQRTNIPHIFAIGDIVGNPMLAHKATHEGKVAAEVAAGHKAAFDARTIPSVAYTDPEIAWMGLTETQAKADGIAYEKAVFPWAASGRSLSLGRDEGLTKLLFDPTSKRLLGAGIVGPNAGELIAEAVLALEMDCEAADLALTIHPHPTLSETLNFAAEITEGSITDLYFPKKKSG
jgi:dihydrolipoamide dehydrogenase